MQTVLLYVSLLLTGLVLQAQNTVEVSINNLSNNTGNVKVGLYNSKADFLEKVYKGEIATISDLKSKTTFTDIPDGIYAVSFFHDEDNDGEFDMFMGMIPTEDYGCSNNAKGRFGPPKWEDAKFELKNGQLKEINISL